MTDDMNFEGPAPIASEFASADSFRGRLILIKVERFEKDVPTQDGKTVDRVTATVTTVDGKGPVEIFAYSTGTGKALPGPEHKGVWFTQQRIVPAIAPEGFKSVGRVTLGRLETYKPGQKAIKGNPWSVLNPTDEDKATARAFLASRVVEQATGPAEAPTDNPFAK